MGQADMHKLVLALVSSDAETILASLSPSLGLVHLGRHHLCKRSQVRPGGWQQADG